MVRWAGCMLLVAACYHPTIPSGAPCETSRDCPGDLECVDRVCGGTPVDAAIDMPVVKTLVLGDSQLRDAEIWIDYPDMNYGMQAHVSNDVNESGLFWFDLTSISQKVLKATFTIRTDADFAATSGGTVDVHRLREGWVESEATWMLRSATQAWSVAGAQPPARDAAPVASFMPNQVSTEFAVELPIDLVQVWIDDPATNFGIVLVRGTATEHVHFMSRETGYGATLALDVQ